MEPVQKGWARHGSTRYLWKDQEVQQAIQYVIDEQGASMSHYIAPALTAPLELTPLPSVPLDSEPQHSDPQHSEPRP